ncbi:MAG TPA: hypothetical protein DHD79_06920 [Firmicutes bacterium]|jgi:phosphoribosyl 1,2-cyclic phosphate phosphodiesterase|nr:hypothetical protein [Bacillota bacterium]HCA29627.1 hypothetical protein [Oscillospiraceae bacterium]HCF93006.1 hypothetical protein [Bacillota bacterium]HCX70960.1 hypothetical protein [Bacillota bacterium]
MLLSKLVSCRKEDNDEIYHIRQWRMYADSQTIMQCGGESFKVFQRQVVSDKFRIKEMTITPIFVEGNRATPYMYLFEDENKKRVLYAPCDTKPFPLENEAVYDVDLLITQPGYFETGLRNGFVFTHLEEYWNRSYSDYKELEKQLPNVRFAYDGMIIDI